MTRHEQGDDPVPAVTSKNSNIRYFHVFEDDEWDESQFSTWIEQASNLPGWGKN